MMTQECKVDQPEPGAEGRVARALGRVVYAGAASRSQADAIMASLRAQLCPRTASRHWAEGVRDKSRLATRVVAALSGYEGAIGRHVAQVEDVADALAERVTREKLADKEVGTLIQRYVELLKCLCELVKQTGERKRSVGEAAEGDDTTLAAILGDDLQLGESCGSTLHDATRQAAAATATVFEAVGQAG
jgi:hypothetical protein